VKQIRVPELREWGLVVALTGVLIILAWALAWLGLLWVLGVMWVLEGLGVL